MSENDMNGVPGDLDVTRGEAGIAGDLPGMAGDESGNRCNLLWMRGVVARLDWVNAMFSRNGRDVREMSGRGPGGPISEGTPWFSASRRSRSNGIVPCGLREGFVNWRRVRFHCLSLRLCARLGWDRDWKSVHKPSALHRFRPMRLSAGDEIRANPDVLSLDVLTICS